MTAGQQPTALQTQPETTPRDVCSSLPASNHSRSPDRGHRWSMRGRTNIDQQQSIAESTEDGRGQSLPFLTATSTCIVSMHAEPVSKAYVSGAPSPLRKLISYVSGRYPPVAGCGAPLQPWQRVRHQQRRNPGSSGLLLHFISDAQSRERRCPRSSSFVTADARSHCAGRSLNMQSSWEARPGWLAVAGYLHHC